MQLTLEEFKLGRFESHHHRGCPDGHLQIADGPRRGGQFCGAVDARAPRPVFVSESAAVTATIRFYHFYNGNQRLDDNFSFTMRYKFLSNKTAAARYGTEHVCAYFCAKRIDDALLLRTAYALRARNTYESESTRPQEARERGMPGMETA